MPSKKPSSCRLSQLGTWAPRLFSYKKEMTLKLPSLERVWATNRNSSSSTFLGPTETFAWKPADMPGVPKELIEHALKVDPKATPKKQQLRRFSPDKREAIKKELAKLLAAGFIKEVYHSKWLANPVLVQKKNNNEWRMCVDYTDLNKHCPNDPFGLPHIDQVIDSTA